MLEKIKAMLVNPDAFTDTQIEVCYELALAEVEAYCGREADNALEIIAMKISVIHLNRLGTEGLANTSFSGVSESYIDGLPDEIMKVLNRKRKIKVV